MIVEFLIGSFIFAGLILFIKHVQKLDAEIGATLAKHQHVESNSRGVVIFWLEPLGLFRYKPMHEWQPAVAAISPNESAPVLPVARQVIPPSQQVHTDALFILKESIKRSPGGRQFMRINDFHPEFAQRWRNATDYLADEWGVIKHRIGEGVAGTFLSSEYATLEDLQMDVIRGTSPLPRRAGVPPVDAQHSVTQAPQRP